MRPVQTEHECELCGAWTVCARHEVFYGTANRKLSIKWGMTAWLCPACHNASNRGVHHHRENDLILKKRYQRIWEESYTREEFIKVFGRSYAE